MIDENTSGLQVVSKQRGQIFIQPNRHNSVSLLYRILSSHLEPYFKAQGFLSWAGDGLQAHHILTSSYCSESPQRYSALANIHSLITQAEYRMF